MQKSLVIILFGWVACSVAAQTNEEEEAYPWLDDWHKSIAESVQVSAQWFDDFFHKDDRLPNQEARGEARITLGWEPRTRDLSEMEAKIKVRVKLPKLKDRVDLIFSDSDDEITQNKVRAGRTERLRREERFSLALRFKPKRDSGFSHRIGTGRRAQIFAKSRYRTQFHFTEDTDLRWEAAIYYYNRDGFGGDTAFTLDHKASEDSMYRLDNRFYFRDESNDWLWQHSIQNFRQVDEKTAVISGLYVEGLSRPNYRLMEYLVSVRWRRNTLREWLFYEVEPFILWRRDEDFSASYGIALRLEGYFGNY